MNFNNFNYLPGLIALFAVFAVVLIMIELKFFRMVKTYWFYNRSIFSYISTILFLSGMGILLFSLLDIRGPEERIKTPVPSNRTIILIDTSASMLAEDVKPSRLQKAALIAKHFARKAVGHQLSIVAFAEIQKKIVPFTNDLDLIDARLDSLKNLRNQYGSSALSVAIQETIQYFRETGEAQGNILVLTDGEETAGTIELKVPKDIHIALVGIGTTQGGRIPLDDSRGFRFGYKKERGKDIITKLNESFFKSAVADIPSGKYWLANTYTLPSDEILDFFKGEKSKGSNEQDMVIKPVLMEWAVIPALLLLIASYFFKAIRIFSLGIFLFIMPVKSQDAEEQPKITPEMAQRLDNLKAGELNKLEKIKLADDLLKAGAKDEALGLYEENLPMDRLDSGIPPEAYLNYGTALLEKGEVQKGLGTYETLAQGIDPKSEKGQQVNEMIEKNVMSYFKQQEQKKKDQKKDKKKEDKENKENKDGEDQGGQGESQSQGQSGEQDKKQQGQPGKDDKKPQDGKDKDEGKDSEKDKQKEKDQGDDPDKDKKSKDPSDADGEKKPIPPKKIPAKLKQLMSDDRQLQMKMIEQGTRDMNRKKSPKSKDW